MIGRRRLLGNVRAAERRRVIAHLHARNGDWCPGRKISDIVALMSVGGPAKMTEDQVYGILRELLAKGAVIHSMDDDSAAARRARLWWRR